MYQTTPKIELTPATLILKSVSSDFCKASQNAHTRTSNLTENRSCAATIMPMIGTRQRFQTPGSALLFVPSCTSLPTAKCSPQFLPLVGRLVTSLQRSAIRNLSIGEVDAFVGSTPLESAVQSVNPSLVGSTHACSDLEFSAESINTTSHVEALRSGSA